MAWVEVFSAFVVCHLVGDYLLQTDRQACHKHGGLGADPVARRALLVAMGLLSAGVFALLYATDTMRSLELDWGDKRFSIRGSRGAPRALMVVKIDDVPFEQRGLRWPSRRPVHADVIDRIAAD